MSLTDLRARLEGRRRELSALRIAVLAGGGSSEREVSLRSGRAVLGALAAKGYNTELLQLGQDDLSLEAQDLVALPAGDAGAVNGLAPTATASALPAIKQADVVFTMLHGSRGENGAWQGLLELAGVPYVSAGVKGSALAMDKIVTKRLLLQMGLPTPRMWIYDMGLESEIPKEIKDLVAKPPAEGSSVGVTMFPNDPMGWDEVHRLEKQYGRLLIEERIRGREMTVGIIGSSNDGVPLPIVEIVTNGEFYDYGAKYSGSSSYECPADLPPSLAERIAGAALEIYSEFDLGPFARIDFMLNEHAQWFFLEANTIPGFTELSLLPMAAKAAGIEMGELLELLMLCAIERHEAQRGAA